MGSLSFIARLIVKSEGKQTAAQLGALGPADQIALAREVVALGRPDLVTWTVDEPEAEQADELLSERDARAIVVDLGVKASRFAAAAAIGEIEGMTRDTKDRRWFDYDKLLEWAELQLELVAGTADTNAEQQDDEGDPGCAQSYRTPWGWIIFWLFAFAFIGWLVVKTVVELGP